MSTTSTRSTSCPKKQRVIVELSEIKDGQQHKYTSNMKSFTKPADIVEIEVIDNHRLKCNFSHMPDYEMFFDCIGLKNEDCINSEVSHLVSDLIVNAKNSCVIRMSAIRELDLCFLHSLFIHELDNYLKPLDNSLQKIYLEYHDIRKYDLVNMMASNHNHQVHSPRKCTKRNKAIGKEFYSTREFFNWMNKEFVYLWSRGSGHDLFELDIYYTTAGNYRTQKIKLSLLQIYLSKLELSLKANLHMFLQYHNQKKKKHFSSLITDLLTEFFQNDDQLLVMFDIPVFRAGVTIVKDMLKLAEDTYMGIQNTKLSNTDFTMEIPTGLNTFPAFFNPHINGIGDALPSNGLFSKTKNISTCQLRSAANIRNNPHIQHQDQLSLQDLNVLSYWYCKIEEQFSNVIKAMESYYSHAYRMKTVKIRTEIEGLFRNYGIKTESDNVSPKQSLKESLEHFNNYQNAIEAFRKLFEDIGKSRFAKNLEVFLRTKNYELLRQFSRFKEIQMENCHTNLIGTISELVGNLKFVETKTHSESSSSMDASSPPKVTTYVPPNVTANSINNKQV